jgi:hypothetical protein
MNKIYEEQHKQAENPLIAHFAIRSTQIYKKKNKALNI